MLTYTVNSTRTASTLWHENCLVSKTKGEKMKKSIIVTALIFLTSVALGNEVNVENDGVTKTYTIKTLSKKGNKYYVDNNEYGEYYTIEGSLKFYDKDGLISYYEGSPIK